MRYSHYKPTGIPWLPEVPEGWEMRPFKSIYGFGKGLPITKENLVAEGVPVVSYGQIHSKDNDGTTLSDSLLRFVDKSYIETNPQCLLQTGDMAIADTSEDLEGCGNAVVMDRSERVFAGYHTIIGRIKESTNAAFLAYEFCCNAWRSQIRLAVHGVKLYSITKQILSGTRFVLPPLSIQRAIVAFLDEKCGKVNRLVAAKEKEVALLKELKQAMIAEAVTGATHVARTDTARKKKPSGIPWLPEVPEGWEVRRLVSLFSNGVKSNKDFVYSRALKFNYGTLIPKNELGDPEEYRDVYVKYSLLQKGDIVINGLNLNYDFNSKRVACAPCDGIITSAYIVCRPRLGIDTSYFTYLFKAMDYQKMFHGMGTGIRLTLSFNELRGQFLPVPPLAEQREIVAYLDEKCGKIDAAVAGLEREVAAMKEYKQRLIADVVTGQRKVA